MHLPFYLSPRKRMKSPKDIELIPLLDALPHVAHAEDRDRMAEVLDMYRPLYARTGIQAPWTGYFIRCGDRIAGTCGFAGLPADGEIEIAYWTFPEFEGLGIAKAACGELLKIARQTDPSLTVVAKTAPAYSASTSILKGHGFQQAGVVQDHEIGDAWKWIRKG